MRPPRRAVEIAAAVAAAVGAVLLLLLAFDMWRVERAIVRDDVRFAAAPSRDPEWKTNGILPGELGTRVLAVDDDVEYRRALRLYWLSRPGQRGYYPEAPRFRGEAQQALTGVSQGDPSAPQRSRATNLLGVLTVGGETAADRVEQLRIVRTAFAYFKNAVKLDEDNDDAKLNLELILNSYGGLEELVGEEPSGTRNTGTGAGAGRAGRGY